MTTTTVGGQPDPDGYLVSVDGATAQFVDDIDAIDVTDVSVGAHAVQLGDVAPGCVVQGADPATATVSSGAVTDVAFVVACPAANRTNALLITPRGLDFGDVQVGATSAPQYVTITNVGASIVALAGTGGAPGGPFAATVDCPGGALAPAASCRMAITFAPTSVGAASGTSSGSWNGQPYTVALSGNGTAPRFLLNPSRLDFGEVVTGTTSATQAVTVTNVGDAAVVVSMTGGAPGAPFKAGQDCQGKTLAPGGTCQVSYSFAPTSTGSASGTSTGSLNGQTFSIGLTGSGIASSGARTLPFLITPTGLDFGDVQLGQTSPSLVATITNVGTSSVTMSGVGGGLTAPFAASTDCPSTLDADASCHVIYYFTPTTAGSASATSSGSWNGQPFSIQVHGTGTSPKFLVTPTALDFGQVETGYMSIVQTSTITNVGLAAVVVSGVGGGTGAPFNATQDCVGITLAVGASCHLTYTFAPTANGSATATSNGSWNGQPYAVGLSGAGVGP